jgi:hypothetical protein
MVKIDSPRYLVGRASRGPKIAIYCGGDSMLSFGLCQTSLDNTSVGFNNFNPLKSIPPITG